MPRTTRCTRSDPIIPGYTSLDAPVDRDGGFRCCPRGSDVARGSRAGVDRVGAVRAAPDLARPADRGANGDGGCLRAGGARDRAGAADPRRGAGSPRGRGVGGGCRGVPSRRRGAAARVGGPAVRVDLADPRDRGSAFGRDAASPRARSARRRRAGPGGPPGHRADGGHRRADPGAARWGGGAGRAGGAADRARLRAGRRGRAPGRVRRPRRACSTCSPPSSVGRCAWSSGATRSSRSVASCRPRSCPRGPSTSPRSVPPGS